jgi:hypothetical protein
MRSRKKDKNTSFLHNISHFQKCITIWKDLSLRPIVLLIRAALHMKYGALVEGRWQARADRRSRLQRQFVHQESHKNWLGSKLGPCSDSPPPSRFIRIILKISVHTSQRITLFLLSQANQSMFIRKIDALHPNGAQTVSTVLIAVYCQKSWCRKYHCATKGHPAHEKCFGHSRRIFEQDKSQSPSTSLCSSWLTEVTCVKKTSFPITGLWTQYIALACADIC